MYAYQTETLNQYHKLTKGTVSQIAHKQGLNNHEPLIIAMDAMLRYAKAHTKAYPDGKLADDGALGECWLDAVSGIRGLLDGNGAVAMIHHIDTDTKDNGCVESMFWAAMDIAGFKEEDL